LQDGFSIKQHQGNIAMNNIFRKSNLFSIPLLILSLSVGTAMPAYADKSVQKQLETNIAGSWRSEKNKARDKYRHPLETLTFFGVTPKANVIELFPGGNAWYTEILAPFLHDSGQLTIINVKDEKEDVGQKEKFAADPAHYGKLKIIEITPNSINFGAPDSADFFLTFRNVHNFAMHDDQAKLFAEIFRVLKPGGVLGIEDHRAATEKTISEVKMSGYLPEEFVIAEAEKAGFKLEARSQINNNPKDTKDYPNGVWSLPPTFADGDANKDKYLAIGESDRLTLRFIKPKK
jgi:predicted methyltransferase